MDSLSAAARCLCVASSCRLRSSEMGPRHQRIVRSPAKIYRCSVALVAKSMTDDCCWMHHGGVPYPAGHACSCYSSPHVLIVWGVLRPAIVA